MESNNLNSTHQRTLDQQLQDQQQNSESDWTHLSIPELDSSAPSTHIQHPLTQSNPPFESPEQLVASSAVSISKIPELQLLTQPNQLLGESDSSTNFDPQAWKRGDTGTTKRYKRTNNSSMGSTDYHPQSHRNPDIKSSVSSSYFIDAAFISPTKNSKSSLHASSSQRRRATSTTRRASRPAFTQSISTSKPNNRSSSDLGPSRGKQLSSNRSNPPTWKAYVGKDGAPKSTAGLSELDRKQEFVEALANLRATARVRKLDYISSNSSSSNNRDHNDENDDGDPDEPHPDHADLPTSTFNSAIDEQEAEQSNSNNPAQDRGSLPDSNFHSGLSRFFRWSSCVGKAISLKTWQLAGLGGLIFGIGIWAGSLIGRNFSHQKHSKIFKFF